MGNIPKSDLVDYRRAKKGEITCAECRHSRIRWWSNRLECTAYSGTPFAVSAKNTCSRAARKNPKFETKE